MQEEIQEFIWGCALSIGVDFLTDLPVSDGNAWILIAIDRFSNACILIPLKALPTAFETDELLFEHVFRNFGIPEDINVQTDMCDRASVFVFHCTDIQNLPYTLSKQRGRKMLKTC